MARIRSIKPDFFTSETIARLPISARLTFVGLWTHVDDNGVCVLNEMLITAALYPLDSPPEALRRITEDLQSLSGEALVRLYRHSGKRYLYVSSWDEHQKVSHPRKPRYPRPDEPGCEPLTCENTNPPERLRSDSGDPPEALRPEQGAGSREQGVPTTSGAARADTAQTLVGEWIDHCAKRPPGNVIGQTSKQIKALLEEGIDPDDVRRGLAAWHSKGLHPSTLPSVVNQVMNSRPVLPAAVGAEVTAIRPATAATGDVRAAANLALVAELRALEEGS